MFLSHSLNSHIRIQNENRTASKIALVYQRDSISDGQMTEIEPLSHKSESIMDSWIDLPSDGAREHRLWMHCWLNKNLICILQSLHYFGKTDAKAPKGPSGWPTYYVEKMSSLNNKQTTALSLRFPALKDQMTYQGTDKNFFVWKQLATGMRTVPRKNPVASFKLFGPPGRSRIRHRR